MFALTHEAVLHVSDILRRHPSEYSYTSVCTRAIKVVVNHVIVLTVLILNLLYEASGLAAGIISPLSDPLDRFRKKIKEKGGKSCLCSNHTHLGCHWPTEVGLCFSNITSVLSLDSIYF